MDKPTQEQIKEFWEWCGLAFKDEQGYHGWYKGVGYTGLEKVSGMLPDIDLNNLFKYAVPKYEELISVRPVGMPPIDYLFSRWLKIMEENIRMDITTALFWALDEVREEGSSSDA